MNEGAIGIGEFNFGRQNGEPFTYKGKHSGRELHGLKLEFDVPKAILAKVDALFDADEVDVADPFSSSRYRGKLRLKQTSYSDQSPTQHYVAEVREVDTWPSFDVLEINGKAFRVLRYVEGDSTGDFVSRFAVLKLSEEELRALRELFDSDDVKIVRRGVDSSPLPVRFGGAQYWSVHEEGGVTFYKHIVRFFSRDDLPEKRPIPIAEGVVQDHLSEAAVGLRIRFEALVQELTSRGVLPAEKAATILAGDWMDLASSEHVREFAGAQRQVDDADEHLD